LCYLSFERPHVKPIFNHYCYTPRRLWEDNKTVEEMSDGEWKRRKVESVKKILAGTREQEYNLTDQRKQE